MARLHVLPDQGEGREAVSGTQKEVAKVKEKASSSSARARTWEVGYVKGGPVERGAEAGPVAFSPKTGSEPDPPQEETSESSGWEQV